jgi:hypothetical protein
MAPVYPIVEQGARRLARLDLIGKFREAVAARAAFL